MPTFIKTGFWEKTKKGYREWLNLDQFVESKIPAPTYKVFTALLTQTGGNGELYVYEGTPTSIGVTYTIAANDDNLADFTNIGAPNNNIGTIFMATGTTPANWGTYAELAYDTNAPVATVLENTIGNIWFTYVAEGIYKANFPIEENRYKIYVNALPNYNNDYNLIGTYFDELGVLFITLNSSFTQVDSLLTETPIEIRVYN